MYWTLTSLQPSVRAVIVEPFFDEGLGNSSYLVASGEASTAVVIDPHRDVDRYLHCARRRGWRITHALETHLHADFLSGSRELAARTGATVVASQGAALAFSHRGVRDQEIFDAGGLRFQALATPGHTPEHICYLVLAKTGEPEALFSGGTLLPGSAARTDLVGPEWTDRLTRALYHSLFDRILVLPDDLPVLPTHGAGSFCASGTRPDRSTTIGHERHTNPLLAERSEEAFVVRALQDLPPYPDYFLRTRPRNQAGPPVLGRLPHPPPLPPVAVHDAVARGALVLDTRPAEAFDTAHLAGSFGIPLSAAFGIWVGWVVPAEPPIILVTDSAEAVGDAVRQLIRVGYDRVEGYLGGGLEAWQSAGYATVAIERVAVAALYPVDGLGVVDVRETSEWRDGHIPGAMSVPLSTLRTHLPLLPHQPLVVHCAHEFRSTVANSLLEGAGFQVRHLAGGFEAWLRAGKPVERSAPPVASRGV